MPLFRKQALAARQRGEFGEIVLVRPLSFFFLTVLAMVMAMAVCAFLFWGSYTRHSTVNGQLVPVSGLIKIYAPQNGVVIERRVQEGQQLQEGDVIYVLSSERHSSTQGEAQAAISREISQRQNSLRMELDKTLQLQEQERRGLEEKIKGTNNEIAKLDNQILSQQDRLNLAHETLHRYRDLLRQDYISQELYQQKQEDLLDQQNRLQSIERDRIGVARDLASLRTELAGLSLKHQNQVAQIERNLSSTDQELTESEVKRRVVIMAPQAGVVTAMTVDSGQAVDSSRPLASIVPASSPLHGELYAPSRAIGFVQPGDKVLIRYQAYPYQKFGHQRGTVEMVAKTALSNNELNASGISSASGNSEPLYRITVQLASQSVSAYGKEQVLQAGMLLDADIEQETLKLYEWVLEPLYSLTGKL